MVGIAGGQFERGDLLPDPDEARRVAVGILHQLGVVVKIEDGFHLPARRLLDGPVDAAKEVFVDGVRRRRRRVGVEAHRDADVIEARRGDVGEEALLEHHAPLALFRRVERVAGVDAPVELIARVRGRVRRERPLRRDLGDAGRERERAEEHGEPVQEHPRMLDDPARAREHNRGTLQCRESAARHPLGAGRGRQLPRRGRVTMNSV